MYGVYKCMFFSSGIYQESVFDASEKGWKN